MSYNLHTMKQGTKWLSVLESQDKGPGFLNFHVAHILNYDGNAGWE